MSKSNPLGPLGGTFKVLRGGSYLRTREVQTCTARNYGTLRARLSDYGFRCVAPAAGAEK